MFGYVKPFAPELKMREHDAYKAVYCGLCHQLGRSFGPFARMTLSYDFTFLAMLGMAVHPEAPVFASQRCFANPLKKCMAAQDNPSLAFSADAAVIMLYYKVLDNLDDSRGLKKLLAWLALPFARSAHRKAAERYPQLEAAVAEAMAEQAALEAENCPSIDWACEPTARALSQICGQLTQSPGNRRVLERFGYLLGRYVYLCDALDDLREDQRTGGYNPFLRAFDDQPERYSSLEQLEQAATDSLFMTIGELAKTYELLTLTQFQPILANVVYLGLKHTIVLIKNKRSEKDDRSL